MLFLVPALYGRIEPLLGFAPAERRREPDPSPSSPEDRANAPILSPEDRHSALVYAENFSFAYPAGEGHALRNVSFVLRRGEVLGVFGPAGAGKSTLCMALQGFGIADASLVLLGGRCGRTRWWQLRGLTAGSRA